MNNQHDVSMQKAQELTPDRAPNSLPTPVDSLAPEMQRKNQELDAIPLSSQDQEAVPSPAARNGSDTTAEILNAIHRAIGDAVQPLLTRLDDVSTQATVLQQTAERIARQQEFFPPQLRQLGGKVDDMATSISEPRLRDLLKSLLLFHDLLDQMMKATANEHDPAVHLRNYQVLHGQILQTLQMNGVEPVPAEGAFDPNLHKAIKTVSTTDPLADGSIVELFRKGFRSQRMVLRYAEVAIGKYQEPAVAVEETTPPSSSDGPH